MSEYAILGVKVLPDPMNDAYDYRIDYRYKSATGVVSDHVLRILVAVSELHLKNYSVEEYLFLKIKNYSYKLAQAFFEWAGYNKITEENYYKPVGWMTGELKFQIDTKEQAEYIQTVYANKITVGDLSITSEGMYDKGELVNSKPALVSPGPDPIINILPGMHEKVKHPKAKDDKACNQEQSIRDLIMHLNDVHRWTREEIADWLDTLDVDLRFKSPEDRIREQREKDIATLTEAMEGLTESILKWTKSIEDAKSQFDSLNEKVKELQQQEDENDQD